MRVQLLGLCRFSYLGGRGFQIEHDSIEARRAFLYHPERLARRWFWFEHLVLPGLVAQTDPDFTLVVMTGPDLPEPYLGHLHDLAAHHPWMRLSIVSPSPYHLPACWDAVAGHIDPKADVIGHFRQDDDDAVAIDFIARARADFRNMRPLWRAHQSVSLDYMQGLVVKATRNGVGVETRMVYNACAGLVIFLAPGDQRTAAHVPHWKVNTLMPGVVMGDSPMYVRLLHHDNDSGAIGSGYGVGQGGASPADLLSERFGIDLTRLDRAAREWSLPDAPRPHWGRT